MIEILLSEKGIPWKLSSNNEIAVCCPFCEDKKFHGRINEELGLYYCYRRGCKGTIKKVLHKLGIHFKQSEIPVVVKTNSEPTQLSNNIDLSKFPKILSKSTDVSLLFKRYLNTRGVTDQQIEQYDLRYSIEMMRVVIPFYENNIPVYWQARAIYDTKKKVLNPSKQTCPLGKSVWLYNIDKAKEFDQVVVCEGWLDAIATGLNAVAIQGSTVSNTQARKIVENWNEITVLLDSDAIDASYRVAKKLKNYNPKVNVYIAKLPYGDPASVPKEVLKQTLLNKIKYCEWEELNYYVETI